MLKRIFFLLFLLSISEFGYSTAIEVEQVDDIKEEINDLLSKISKADGDTDKGKLFEKLAIAYLVDQDQERAFEAFLSSLEDVDKNAFPLVLSPLNKEKYQKALTIYFDQTNTPQESAQLITQQFLSFYEDNPENCPLGYLIAISYANTFQYKTFFDLFYQIYPKDPGNFLAYKTKAILHMKLMERKHVESERQTQREAVLFNLKNALGKQPQDVTLYKLLIVFAFPETKSQQVQLYLHKIIEGNIIIPRTDVQFYVQEAVDAQEFALAQEFIDQARKWYPQSQIITRAQDYLNRKRN